MTIKQFESLIGRHMTEIGFLLRNYKLPGDTVREIGAILKHLINEYNELKNAVKP